MEKTTNNETEIVLEREGVIKRASEIREKIAYYEKQLYTLLNSPGLNESTQSINFDFYLSNKAGTRVRTVYCQNKKFIYYSYLSRLNCNVPISFKKVFNEAKIHLDKYVKEYKNYKIQRKPITNSTFRMIINYNIKPNDMKHSSVLYEIDIDNTNNNKITYEFKNNSLIEESKKKFCSFSVDIEVELYNHNKFFQYDGEKDPIIEDVCIIRNKNKPNVLITKCFHLVVCSNCNRFKDLNACPRCNKPLAAIHKIHFAVSGK